MAGGEVVLVVMNEQHSLLPEQERILRGRFGGWEVVKVPARGWTRAEMDAIANRILGVAAAGVVHVVFVSPVPYLLARLSYIAGSCTNAPCRNLVVWLFHNDRREKVELPDGRIIYRVPREGWELVRVV
jgi:hypothetical protein